MPVYNGEQYLAEAIDSILSQTFSDFELILVDDGSQDNSIDLMRAYQDRDERISIFQLDRNMGMADARNYGIAKASGQYITTMDCDDISLPRRLQLQVVFLESNAEVGAVGISGQAVNEDLTSVLFELSVPPKHAQIVLANFVGVSFIYTTVMARSALMRSVGGYQPGRRSGEERELYWRMLWGTRARFANLPENLYTYRQHGQSFSANRDAKLKAETDEVRAFMLRQLWGEAPAETLDRFFRMAQGGKLGWLDRRAAKHDMTRLIDAFASHGLVELDELPLLADEAKRHLEGTMPRLWQKFLHWRRHRLRRLRSLTNAVS